MKKIMKNNDVPEEPRRDRSGTAAGGGCFEVRVEPLCLEYREWESGLGFFERRRAPRRGRGIVRSANDWLSATRVDPGDRGRQEGGCVAHLRAARMGLIRLLKRYVEARTSPGALGECPHLEALRDRGCLILPPDLWLPFPLSPGKKERPLWVLSAPRLRAELVRFKKVSEWATPPASRGRPISWTRRTRRSGPARPPEARTTRAGPASRPRSWRGRSTGASVTRFRPSCLNLERWIKVRIAGRSTAEPPGPPVGDGAR